MHLSDVLVAAALLLRWRRRKKRRGRNRKKRKRRGQKLTLSFRISHTKPYLSSHHSVPPTIAVSSVASPKSTP